MGFNPIQFVNNQMRKLAVIVATITFALGSFITPALAEETDSPVVKEPISRFSTDPEDIISFCAGSIENGYGELYCYMTTGNQFATIQAKTGPNSNAVGSVDCYVQLPTGGNYYLGTIPASNGATGGINFNICPYGTYKFIYEADTNVELDVMGFIYD
ncbi:MAG: hypothetical protein IKG14_05920 [Clostridia bacterium]|nr:hypothetical protein [Clostridia bacterium]